MKNINMGEEKGISTLELLRILLERLQIKETVALLEETRTHVVRIFGRDWCDSNYATYIKRESTWEYSIGFLCKDAALGKYITNSFVDWRCSCGISSQWSERRAADQIAQRSYRAGDIAS
jgi:hypothetical protein